MINYNSCCGIKGGPPPLTCDIQSGSNFTFTITVGQNVAGDKFGYSNAVSGEAFGSRVMIHSDVGQAPTDRDIDFFGGDGNANNWFSSEERTGGGGHYEGFNDLYVNGVLYSNWYSASIFSLSDVGQTFCISGDAWMPG